MKNRFYSFVRRLFTFEEESLKNFCKGMLRFPAG